MRIDEERIAHIAELAKLRPDQEEREQLKKDLSGILEFIEKLEEVDTEGVEPLKHLTQGSTALRKDEVQNEVESQEEALKNAPQRDSDYIKVPRFVDRGTSS